MHFVQLVEKICEFLVVLDLCEIELDAGDFLGGVFLWAEFM